MRKDYFGSVHNDELIISSNPNSRLITLEDMEDLSKRYLYKIGDKIVTPFGIETIKNIDKNYGIEHGYEWLITVEENRNQYKPCELIGIYVKTIKIETQWETNYDNRDLKNINRQRAIEWWESLTLEVIDLQEKYYPYAGTPQNLTGYQIQKIWEHENSKHVT